jgi:hypothetical protein
MKRLSSRATTLCLANLQVATSAQVANAAITITPNTAQAVITGAPERFSGSVRVESLFDAKAPRDRAAVRSRFSPEQNRLGILIPWDD